MGDILLLLFFEIAVNNMQNSGPKKKEWIKHTEWNMWCWRLPLCISLYRSIHVHCGVFWMQNILICPLITKHGEIIKQKLNGSNGPIASTHTSAQLRYGLMSRTRFIRFYFHHNGYLTEPKANRTVYHTKDRKKTFANEIIWKWNPN